jgi:regulator of cell morphogenesis and NO signaling
MNGVTEWGEQTVGAVVADDYGRAAVFQRFGIDFCCGGGRTVRSACETGDAGADFEAAVMPLEDDHEHAGAGAAGAA